MFIEIGGFIIVSAIVAGVTVFAAKGKTSSQSKRNPFEDYTVIKSALVKYRKEKMGLVPDISELEPYLEEDQKVDFSAYRLSADEKFLVTTIEGISNPEGLANQVGGESYVMGNSLHLSFNTLASKKDDNDFEPVASFKVFPEHINTMTNVVYDTSDCRAVDGEIMEYKWEKALQNFDIPGDYKLKLRIRDKKGRWSKSCEKSITVVREEGLSKVYAGGTSVFVVHKDGKVDVMGSNGYGQLGMGNINGYKDREMNTFLHSVVEVAASDHHTVIRKINGTIYSFGKNDFGQLGSGAKGDMKSPKEIWGIKNAIQVSVGDTFSAALDAYGRVYTWGDNMHGQLGAERSGSREMPMHLEAISEIKQISMGFNFGMAVRQDGTVYSWGDNQYGQLGLGFKSKQSEVTMTTLKKIDKVVCGRNFAFAIDSKGEVFGWGTNQKNQLGIIGQNEILFPVELAGLKKIVDIKTYGNYSIALDQYGKIYTWGQYNVLSDTYLERPKLMDHLPLAVSIAACDRYAYLLTADDRVLRFSGDSAQFEEMLMKPSYAPVDLTSV